jgi:uncharacterized protein (DUF2126 family)
MAAIVVRPVVVLKLPTQVKQVITFAQSIATAMMSNPSFPTPSIPLATLQADIAALSTAEAAVLTRTKGSVELRDQKLAVVRADLETLKAYVQTVAGAGTPEAAPAVIASAGLAVRKSTLHDKAALEAKDGSVSGTVNLIAKAAARTAAYAWQYSVDQKTWTATPVTLQAKTGVPGLTAGTTYYFRVQTVTRTGAENWSQIIALVVK